MDSGIVNVQESTEIAQQNTRPEATTYDIAQIMGGLYGDGFIALNLTTVDVYEDMGPFEIAPGTQWDLPEGFEHGMFPPKSNYPRYQQRAQRKMPKMGDISARSALTIHRGTANQSDKQRPALVLGVDAPDANNAE